MLCSHTVRRSTTAMFKTVVRVSNIKPAGLTICELTPAKNLTNVMYAKNASQPMETVKTMKRDI